MKSVAVCGSLLAENPLFAEADLCDGVTTVSIESIPICFGRVDVPEPDFDPQAAENQSKVLIKVRAFSCNYRDKAIILQVNQLCPPDSFCCIGSEFVGEVIAVGRLVDQFAPGDRVMGNNAYPDSGVKGVKAGVPTSEASQRYWIGHAAKLVKAPPAMPDVVAAAFSLGAQTAYSLVRKLDLRPGCNILITAARANTSLFVIHALRQYPVHVYATSTAAASHPELQALGVKEIVSIDPTAPSFGENARLKELVTTIGGFDGVVDPFFDLHLGKAIDVLKPGARYITCGFYDQHSNFTGQPLQPQGRPWHEVMAQIIFKNIQLIGNCLGQTADLHDALCDYTAGSFDVIIDSVFRDQQVGAFFDRTYNDRDRFGKVVYHYPDTEE
jgi:NADPH:quinone reductase-like Zn-dependent oxidoreductase